MSNCCKCSLVDEACFRKYAGFPAYVRWQDIEPHLFPIHDLYVSEIIGFDCINELCEAIENNTVTAIQQELLDLLLPYISYSTAYHYYDFQVQATGAGPQLRTTNDTRLPAGQELTRQMSLYKREIAQYKDLIYAFLAENSDSFPCLPAGCRYWITRRMPNVPMPLMSHDGNAAINQSVLYPDYILRYWQPGYYINFLRNNYYDTFFLY